MFSLHLNPLKALSQTALTSTGQAFVPRRVHEGEKLSALFVFGCHLGSVWKRFSPYEVENFVGFYSITL